MEVVDLVGSLEISSRNPSILHMNLDLWLEVNVFEG